VWKQLGHLVCKMLIAGSHGHGRGQPRRHLACKGGTRKGSHGAGPQGFLNDLMRQAGRAQFQSLGGPNDARARRNERLQESQHTAQGMAGDHDQYRVDSANRSAKIRLHREASGEGGIRQVTGIAAGGKQLRRMLGTMRPQGDAMPRRAKWMARAVPQDPAPSTAMACWRGAVSISRESPQALDLTALAWRCCRRWA